MSFNFDLRTSYVLGNPEKSTYVGETEFSKEIKIINHFNVRRIETDLLFFKSEVSLICHSVFIVI